MSRRAATPTRPVSRRSVAVGAAVAAVLAAALMTGVWSLRPDVRVTGADLPPLADVRDETFCAEDPREGAEREEEEQPGIPRVASSQLLDCPQDYDGDTIRYRGEVVGAVLERDDGAWLQLNDDDYAGDLGPLPTHDGYRGLNSGVGVWVTPQIAEQVTSVGGPGRRGDVVEVVGPFQRVDPLTGEVAIIRANLGEVVVLGAPVDRRPAGRLWLVAGPLLGLAAVTIAVERLRARRR